MGEKQPQTLKNHARIDPAFHYVLSGLLLIILVQAVILVIHWHDPLHLTVLLIALALFLLAGIARTYALKVQDRVIRLEERIRLMSVLPPLLHHRIAELSVSQLVALRFASDQELMALTARVFEEKLSAKQIKAAIIEWRPDYFRV